MPRFLALISLVSLPVLAGGEGFVPPPEKSTGGAFTFGVHLGTGLHTPAMRILHRLELRAGARLSQRFSLVATVSTNLAPLVIWQGSLSANGNPDDWSLHGQHGVVAEWRPTGFLTVGLGPLLSVGRMAHYRPELSPDEYYAYDDGYALRVRPAIDARVNLSLPMLDADDARRARFSVGFQMVVLFITDTHVLWTRGTTIFTLTSFNPMITLGFEWR